MGVGVSGDKLLAQRQAVCRRDMLLRRYDELAVTGCLLTEQRADTATISVASTMSPPDTTTLFHVRKRRASCMRR